MRVVITGGGGFLGSMLCARLLERGTLIGPSGYQESIEKIVLLDSAFTRSTGDPRIEQLVGDISDRDAVFAAVGSHPAVAVFHLASMVSGECEARYDDAMRVNLDGGRNVFEAARNISSRHVSGMPRVVFASSIACFGGDEIPESCSDDSKQLPQTTYGMTKAICELMINDHSRKGHFDGRSARLPTVIVRPGKPNAAASSWASGMFREPLAGEACLLPVRRDQCHPMTGYRTVIDSLVALHDLDGSQLGKDRAVGLPAHCVTPLLAESVVNQISRERGIKAGPIVDAFDARIQGIVDGWATGIDGTRAVRLGLPMPPPLSAIVQQYLDDFGMPR
jgi:nucleoside-diphosphate-sugar epimerase